MLYKEWIDFVIYPSDSNRVKTREERLDTQNAIPEIERYGNPELAKKVGFIVNWNDYVFTYDNDKFEAMWIDDIGNVTIWTEKRVWSLHRRIDGKEKIIYVPRNPDLSQLF
jgi:hypothetical protein